MRTMACNSHTRRVVSTREISHVRAACGEVAAMPAHLVCACSTFARRLSSVHAPWRAARASRSRLSRISALALRRISLNLHALVSRRWLEARPSNVPCAAHTRPPIYLASRTHHACRRSLAKSHHMRVWSVARTRGGSGRSSGLTVDGPQSRRPSVDAGTHLAAREQPQLDARPLWLLPLGLIGVEEHVAAAGELGNGLRGRALVV